MSVPKAAAAKSGSKSGTEPARRTKPAPAAAANPVRVKSNRVKSGRTKPVPVKPATLVNGEVSVGASAEAKKLATEINRALAAGHADLLSTEALQALMAAVCRSYSAQIEAGASFPPVANRNSVTSTDVMVTASGLLKSANLAVFELGMWQSWTGR
jgi:hypothetical protein